MIHFRLSREIFEERVAFVAVARGKPFLAQIKSAPKTMLPPKDFVINLACLKIWTRKIPTIIKGGIYKLCISIPFNVGSCAGIFMSNV